MACKGCLNTRISSFAIATDRARRPLGTSVVLRLTRAVKGQAVLRTLGALCRSAIVVILAPFVAHCVLAVPLLAFCQENVA